MIVPTFSPPLCAQCGDGHKITTLGTTCSACDGDGFATGPPESRPCRKCKGLGRLTTVRDCTSEPCTLIAAVAADPRDNTRRLVLADWCDKRDRPEAARDLRLWVAQQAVVENIDDDAPRLEWARIAESVAVDEAELAEVREKAKNAKYEGGCDRVGNGIEQVNGEMRVVHCGCERSNLLKREAALSRTVSLHRRAEFVRVQCAISDYRWGGCESISANWCPVCGDCRCRHPEDSKDDAHCPLHSPESMHAVTLAELRKRERELLRADVYDWTPRLLDRARLAMESDSSVVAYTEMPPESVRVQFRRGFISEIRCSWQQWIDHGQRLVMGAEACGRCVRYPNGAAVIVGTQTPYWKCPTCSVTGRVPRPFTGSEQPVTRLTLDTPVDLEWQVAASVRHATTLSNDPAALVRAEWPQLRGVDVPPR